METQHFASATDLVGALSRWWHGPRPDPFSFDLAVVPSTGFQRWLSQQLATDHDGEGICAGVEFRSPARLWHQLAGDDPWHPTRLAWRVQQAVLTDPCPAELAIVRTHLDASRETFSVSTRIAAHFAGYAAHAPDMLRNWAKGRDVDSVGRELCDAAWQAHLWRMLVTQSGVNPLDARVDLLNQLRLAPADGVPERIAVIAPHQLDASTLEFYQALGAHHDLRLMLLTHAPDRRFSYTPPTRRGQLVRTSGHPLNQTLGWVCDEDALLAPAPSVDPPSRPENLLGWLAGDLFADQARAPRRLSANDRSVQVHLSHGPARQVEVLREVLAALYAADTSLQPRHVAILTPDVDTFAPLLDAAFTPQPGVAGHPAQQFRLRLADRTAAQTNPLVGLLLELLRLPDSRLEAATLLEFCANQPVADRFGFSADGRERLSELVAASGIRWGLNAAHRADYGLANLPHNSWQAGLQRMLLGVAMSEQDQVSVGTVLPMDDIDSSDVTLIGALVELVGRLARWRAEIGDRAPMSVWTQRCRDALETFTTLAPDQEWQRADLNAGLARLSEAAGVGTITRQAALTAIEQEFATAPTRGAFGNGSTVVAGLNSLRGVPHRVIVLLGWDAERYPRSPHRHGDDLLGEDPLIGTPSPALADRHALLDAIHAAEQALVVIARGRSEATNEPVPPATPIAELLDALDATAIDPDGRPAGQAVTLQHPLQPFALDYFAAGSSITSVDSVAFRAARAWAETLTSPAPARDRFRLEPLPPWDFGVGVGLDELADFFRHPARSLLKTRAGISLGEYPTTSEEIPIEPDGLARWQIGNRVLRRLQEGSAPEAVEHAEWLRGQVPPYELGRQLMGDVMAEARRTLAHAPAAGESTQHDLSVAVAVPGVGAVTLTGRVATRERTLWQVKYSSLQPRQKLAAWLRLVALAAAEEGPWEARVIGKGRQVRYQAPPPDIAGELLGRYLAIYALGLRRPLPALPRVGAEWAALRLNGRDPDDPRQEKSLRRLWDWESDAAWSKFFSFPEVLALDLDGLSVPGADRGETRLLGALASAIWAPILAAEVAW